MAEKDPTARLRRAVKENNLFLVKRLVQRTDQRNPDPNYQRYTSLAWAAVQGNEETFEWLLANGHDDYECSRDVENNTILMLLADQRGALSSPGTPLSSNGDHMRAALRMATLYFERYPKTLDWTNIYGKTPLHAAALKGNEELVRMLCDLGADFNLTDNQGNTPLHYASAWGHIPVVQLLIERGCQYSARNDEGFTASDYAYSYSTRDTLQDAARLQFELNKKSRRAVFAQAATRGSEMAAVPPSLHSEPSRARDIRSPSHRMRSGSGTSRTTATSDSGEYENVLAAPHSQSSLSSSSSPSQPSASSHSHYHGASMSHSVSANPTFPGQLNPPANPASALSQLASRVRERDADAMEKYLRRNRSESSSTDNRSANGSYSSTGQSNSGDNVASLNVYPSSGASTPKRLRPSISATHLRSTEPTLSSTPEQPEHRTRSGTNPSSSRPSPLPHPILTRSSSISNSNSPRSLSNQPNIVEEPGSFTGPPSQYAQFPEPPLPPEDSSTPTAGRRMAFHSLAKPLPGLDSLAGHRRGMSAASFRGT